MFHFMRETGTSLLHYHYGSSHILFALTLPFCTGEEKYRVRGENAYLMMKKWSRHSDWNFKNKLRLIEAERHNALHNYDKATLCYRASIMSAQEHKFVHEEAIANELAAFVFLKRRDYLQSYSYLMQATECYEKWGAHAPAKRVEDDIRNEKYGFEVMHLWSRDHPVTPPPALISIDSSSKKKRQLDGHE